MLVFPPKNSIIPESSAQWAACGLGCAFFSGKGLDGRQQRVWFERQEHEWLGALFTAGALEFAAAWRVLPSGGWGQLNEVWGGRLAQGALRSPLTGNERSRLLFATLQVRSAHLDHHVCFSVEDWTAERLWLIDPDFGRRKATGPLAPARLLSLAPAQHTLDARGPLRRPSELSGPLGGGIGSLGGFAPISLFDQVAQRTARRANQKAPR